MRIGINIWKILGLALIILLSIVFIKILLYIIIASILFLIGSPITKKIESIHIKNFKIPDTIASLITIILLVSIVAGLFSLIVPPLINQVNKLSGLNFYDVLHDLLQQFPRLNNALNSMSGGADIKASLSEQIGEVLNFSNFSLALNNLFSYAGTIIGGTLCILFITFFFLKDEQILKESILVLTPSRSEKNIKEILHKSKDMLSKYFSGLFADMLIVGTLASGLLFIIGIENALIIGVTAGILNVVPYIGSAITMCIALFLGVSSCIASGEYFLISATMTKIFFTLLSINLTDAFIIQPFIFSNSVKAHPLEIFIVTLMGATLGGIGGMIMALPAYTILRIIAHEFLTKYKFFQKITENLND